MANVAKMKSRLQQLSIAIEQHHQAYLGQQPLVLMATEDHAEFLEYAKESVGREEPPFTNVDNQDVPQFKYVFGAPVDIDENLPEGVFVVAKLVHYV